MKPLKQIMLAAILSATLLGGIEIADTRGVGVAPITLVGCTPAQVKTVNDVENFALDHAQLACILAGLAGDLLDPEAIAGVCKITEKLDKAAPIIRNLVAVREAAKAAPEGRLALLRFKPSAASNDAGSDAGH